ncbi:Rne/Rng family ribonuclease, partial [Proteiniphilum sp. UBA5384]|uniref:Rne/Rng family ribonuclease n=1 Tax=Proteiniphilum sp. UBA5384 TaxID=1947279 RepID=UPI0025F65A0B
QVIKQPGGSKGARVTTHVTLPGRLLVLMPTVDHIGISRRIEDEAERERLKELVLRIKPAGMGVILRTAAEHASEEEIEAELRFYARLWDRICDKADFLTAPRLIHAEENLLFRTARDMLTDDVTEFVINDKDYFEKITALVNIISPNLVGTLQFYDKPGNIFDDYGIEDKISKALMRKVWMKNGCYLVIDETEALTVIDVNTGKYIGEDNLQETILNANIEAAEEIARQLRLRDISGIIVIDFIDMESDENRRLVVERLDEALKKDRTKSNVFGMTELGLVQMTRKKMRRGLSSLTQATCPVCGGSGKVYSMESMAMRVRRDVVRAVKTDTPARYLVEVAPALEEYIVSKNNQNQAVLPIFENVQFYVRGLPGAHPEHIQITKLPEKNMPNGAQVFC